MLVPTLTKGGFSADDRGIVRFVNGFRFDLANIKRFYMLENWRPGFVRAWHGHRTESKYIMVVSGAALVQAVPLNNLEAILAFPSIAECKLYSFVLTENEPAVLYVPGGYANGAKALIEGTRIMHFSDLAMEDTHGDDVRFDWDILPHVWDEQQR